MINLPLPPDTFTTLQIQCVACQELFTVAESHGTAEEQWRLPSDHHPSVQMRYETNLTRQPIRAFTRADPAINSDSFSQENCDVYVNCPRCGADNRNWLKITSPSTTAQESKLLYTFSVWRQRFPGAFISVLLSCILALLAFFLALSVEVTGPYAAILAIGVVLAAIFTTTELTKGWKSLRLDSYIGDILPRKPRSQEAKLWQRGAIIIFLFSIIMPFVFFYMTPRALQLAISLISSESPTAVQTGQQRLEEIKESYTSTNLAAIKAIDDTIAQLEDIEKNSELGSPATEAQIASVIAELQEKLEDESQLAQSLAQQNIDQQIKNLETYTEETKALMDNQRVKQDQATLEATTASLRFLIIWLLMVGLTTLISVFMSMRTLKKYVAFIDRMLPSPIFCNIADMARVTIWEAKRSLQIEGDMSHIQWTRAKRNDEGGIKLTGYHCAPPDRDQQNNIISPRVRAQCYVINTDKWGRILDTFVQDVHIPYRIPYAPPKIETPVDEAQNPPPAHALPSPTSPSGDDLAYDFFGVPSSAPENPQQEAASHERMVSHITEPTAVSHPFTPNIFPPEVETPRQQRDRLIQQLALTLCQKFTNSQLQKLYRELGMDYGRSPGTRLQLCQDLIRFYQRRHQLPKLVEEAIDMHPHILWGEIFDLLEN